MLWRMRTAIANPPECEDAIKEPLTKKDTLPQSVESVGAILESESGSATGEWLQRVNADENLHAIELDDKTRSSHLPQLFNDLVDRLHNPLPLGTKGIPSKAAHAHGLTRRKQGYSAAMLVEESRILQVSIFNTLHKNEARVDFNTLLPSVMVIADEVDLQLAEAMTSFIGEAGTDAEPKISNMPLAPR
jgi:hypothetical protein